MSRDTAGLSRRRDRPGLWRAAIFMYIVLMTWIFWPACQARPNGLLPFLLDVQFVKSRQPSSDQCDLRIV